MFGPMPIKKGVGLFCRNRLVFSLQIWYDKVMLMIASVCLFILGGVGALVAGSFSRKAKMSRFARTMGVRFAPEKENIITEITANKMDYFIQCVHRFENVLTFAQGGTYMRVGDDTYYPEGKPRQKQLCTLFSAELMINHFPSLKIEPASRATHTEQYVPVRTNIEEIDKNYNIFLPPDTALNLSPALSSLLKNQKDIYFESADNVCIMHCYKMLTPEEIQPFRFRALQVVSDLEIAPPKPTEEGKSAAVDAGTRAEAMVAAMMAAHARPAGKGTKSSGPMLLVIMMIGLAGMLAFAFYFLKHIAGR